MKRTDGGGCAASRQAVSPSRPEGVISRYHLSRESSIVKDMVYRQGGLKPVGL